MPITVRLALVANMLLRIAGGAMVGFYLADAARRGQGVDPALVGLLAAVANGTEVVGAIPVGILVDRTSPRLVLVWSTVIGAGATLLFGLAGSVALLFVSRSLESLAAIAGGPALLHYLADTTRHDGALRVRAMSYYELSLLAGLSVGNLVGGLLWDSVQRMGFAILAAVYVVAASLFWWTVRLPVAHVPPMRSPRLRRHYIPRDRSVLRLAPAWLAVNAVIGLWLSHIGYQLTGPPMAGQRLVGVFSASEAGLILLGCALALALGVLAWSRVIVHVPAARALWISLGGLLLLCLWIALLNSPIVWPTPTRLVLLGAVAGSLMVGSGFTPVALVNLANTSGRSDGKGATFGVYTALFASGNMLGAALGGLLARTLALNGLVLGTVGLTLAAFAALIFWPQPHPESGPTG